MEGYSSRSVYLELPEILAERGISLSRLSADIDLARGHLSRALRRAEGKVLGPDLIVRISVQLGLPEDYWPEVRIHRLASAYSHSAEVMSDLDRVYRRRVSGRLA